MNRRDFVKIAGAGMGATGLVGVLGNVRAAEKGRKNILFIFVDDLRVQLSCYGRTQVKSPNIDKLAQDGTLFEHAYCSQAVCAPSRICTLSGMRPDQTGIYDLDHPFRQSGNDDVTLPQYFKDNGYETISIGKIYHHANDDQRSWTIMPKRGGPMYAIPESLKQVQEKLDAAKAEGLTGDKLRKKAKGPATECADVQDNVYADGMAAEEAVKQLQAMASEVKPFLMCVGFLKPHLPFCAPKKYWDMYRRADFSVPDKNVPEAMPPIALADFGELRAYSDIPQVGSVDDEQSLQLIHGYHACVSYTDAMIGKVLGELEKLGLANNTIVVLWGDHGWKLGDYGSWCKHSNFELDTHVPLIFRGSGIKAGYRCPAIVEMVDVYPTLADLTGGKAPSSCAGSSMRDLLQGMVPPSWKNMAVSQYPRGHNGMPVMGYSLRKDQWRYTEWHRKDVEIVARELYDHSLNDVAKINLADKPEYAEKISVLSEQLKPFLKTKWASMGGGRKKK